MTNFLKYLIFFVASGCFDSSDDLRDNDPAHVLDVPKDEEEEAVGKKDQSKCPFLSRQGKNRNGNPQCQR